MQCFKFSRITFLFILLSASELIFGTKIKRLIIKNKNIIIEIIKLILFSK